MPDTDINAAITVTWENTTEQPFKPKGSTEIFAKLIPIEREQATYFPSEYTNYYPTLLPPYMPSFEKLPEFESTQKELIINIETTGTKPWESRIICIGVMDPNTLEPKVTNFLEETEVQTLDAFLQWLEGTSFSHLVGYNVSFDYRFIYALMQKYRRSSAQWKNIKLYDLMQQQKQVKDSYVFGYNPTGTLEQWATYLLGSKPYAPQKQVYKWLKEKNIDEIVNFNTDKVTKAYYLWVLDKVVSEEIPGSKVLARPAQTTTQIPIGQTSGTSAIEEETVQVQCPNCLQLQEMPKSASVINCLVCGTPVANPSV